MKPKTLEEVKAIDVHYEFSPENYNKLMVRPGLLGN